MKFAIYEANNDRDYGCFNYIVVLNTFEEASVLKDELVSTNYCFDGVLFVGTDEGLSQASIKVWYDHEHIKEQHKNLHEILVKHNYFGAPKSYKERYNI